MIIGNYTKFGNFGLYCITDVWMITNTFSGPFPNLGRITYFEVSEAHVGNLVCYNIFLNF